MTTPYYKTLLLEFVILWSYQKQKQIRKCVANSDLDTVDPFKVQCSMAHLQIIVGDLEKIYGHCNVMA